jgi:hypothetical protein
MIINKDIMFKRFNKDDLKNIDYFYQTVVQNFLTEELKYKKSGIIYQSNILKIVFQIKETEKSIIITKCN